ncbi:biotin--[acetyl-CoA-carboxylase] ligase [Aeromicrobium phragmitis]|uniref:biotin--[biotin carboxyl-carrier protein] ligase n=1 Tax=Aeromicrobium phragmitis TaxID=2478914 RepID=A0A3L8PHF5_9ACTN|nr:biotin--[acetyl-CoA-carboxylase] ligase [Aeromicrobium phragmitis]RLV54736.1 biotin--[acetyl-CoA-carboxylase] ligase [Aeromicrobium phragmitis]
MSSSPHRRPCDLARTPLDVPALEAALRPTRWQHVVVTAESPSTNAELAEAARAGAPSGSVVTTDHQAAGRGRLDRTFVMPPMSGIAVSALIRPDVPLTRWSWLPLVAGLAVADAIAEAGVAAGGIKWPNDVLVDGRKISGILLERVEPPAGSKLRPAAVIGMGVNVSVTEADRPVETATSLLLEGAEHLDRTVLVTRLLTHLDRWLAVWEDDAAASFEELRDAFVRRCVTVGQHVRLTLPDGSREGTAETVDEFGRLVVDGQPFSAGDITHVRPAG